MTNKFNLRYLLVALLVLASYVIFAFPGLTKDGVFTKTPGNYYQALTSSFLDGHVYLPIKPSEQLLKLADPYDPKFNLKLRLFDASLYKGKYYLYFGVLPVISFFLPIKLLTGWYPATALGVLLFVSVGFIMNFLLLIKIKNLYFNSISQSQVCFFGLIIGLANNGPYLFFQMRVYEIAIASTYCFTSIALYYLFRAFTEKNRSNLIVFSVCIALAASGRAHFLVMAVLLIASIGIYHAKYIAMPSLRQVLPILTVPLMVVCIAQGYYNYVRFDSVFEFGINYQLGLQHWDTSLVHSTLLKLFPLQIYYYFFSPYPEIMGNPIPTLFSPLGFKYSYEFCAGMLTTAPFVIFIFMLPKLFSKVSNQQHEIRPLIWFLASVAFSSLMISLFLFIHPATAQRYESDFLPYLLICAILSIWILQSYTAHQPWLSRAIKQFLMLTGLLSILMGISFGILAYGFLWDLALLHTVNNLMFASILITLGLTYAAIKLIKPLEVIPFR